jgi:hypothetical protein
VTRRVVVDANRHGFGAWSPDRVEHSVHVAPNFVTR